ncbi:hypothetical protein ACFQY8_05975 [Alloscardovia venturai]|uniref:WXG100 family type VII secretion target n=2 Tax=Alloscardovia venturai TaxID=1769421 RepID=A0ABW2Y7Q9_9BIFI
MCEYHCIAAYSEISSVLHVSESTATSAIQTLESALSVSWQGQAAQFYKDGMRELIAQLTCERDSIRTDISLARTQLSEQSCQLRSAAQNSSAFSLAPSNTLHVPFGLR